MFAPKPISTYNFEAVWGQYGLESLIVVDSYANIKLQLHFVSLDTLEAVISNTWFYYIGKTITYKPLTSRHLWGKKFYIVGIVVAIGQGNFHIKENCLKFTNSLELTNSSKSAEFHFNKFVDFIGGPTFLICTYSES